ncbi:hypothetical protein [Rhodanobacter sp. OK091]|uniref:hypothetical protein n=1 Tax=Rhodanobacter sp. OK091 TaxID=1881037 RepID=UPI0009122BAE|nr:hypothetical protein [Rhodanobacter sp. OK091]SHM15470.1 hypothetical protein SAMN05428972_2605 [Rhodanobacter sp. OK091]
MAIKHQESAFNQLSMGPSRKANVVPLRLYDMRTPPSFAQWAQTVELILAIEPDPTVAMAWFVGEDIAELDGLTGYELVQAGKKSLLDDFLRAILEGHCDE